MPQATVPTDMPPLLSLQFGAFVSHSANRFGSGRRLVQLNGFEIKMVQSAFAA
jgi:hypothetical protein